jgi:hypothetical protein
MEDHRLLVAFVGVLVDEVAHMRAIAEAVVPMTGQPPSSDSAACLELSARMVENTERTELIAAAEAVHAFVHGSGADEAYPCDHLIDMLSGCASAIRFGLEFPCHSRHAAAAAEDVWKRRYGVQLFDDFTSAWCHEWVRAKFVEALARIAFP